MNTFNLKALRLGTLFSAALAASGTWNVAGAQPPTLQHIERYIAMDGACAWPQVTVLSTGELAALIWPYPNHGFNEGAVELWVSQDDGRTWSFRSVPVKNIPGVARLNHAGGVVADGSYVTIVGGFGGKPPVEGASTYQVPRLLPNPEVPIPALTRDQGDSWERNPAQGFLQADGQNLIPYGRIAQINDEGHLGVTCYLYDVVFFVSKDHGLTWEQRGVVSTGRIHNETAWLRLRNGDLYAAARTWDGGRVDGLRSTDNGRTWQVEGALTLPGQHPADLTELPDGSILLTYGIRNQGLWGIGVRIADTECRQWGPPILLVDMEGATDNQAQEYRPGRRMSHDGGYPSTVVARDGALVTAYYTKGNPTHRRYHVGIVRWQLIDAATAAGRDAGN